MIDPETLEQQLEQLELQMLLEHGVVPGADPAQQISELAALTASIKSWDEALHPRGLDGRFISVNGWVKGTFDWVDKRHMNKPGKGKSNRIDASRVKVTGIASGDGASADNPWVRVEFDGDDPKFNGKVGFARAKDLTPVGDTKATLDGGSPETTSERDGGETLFNAARALNDEQRTVADKLRMKVHDRKYKKLQAKRAKEAASRDDDELVASVVAAIGHWDESLHPRGRDGRFISVAGWVKGLFSWVDKREMDSPNKPNGRNRHSKSVGRVKVTGLMAGDGASVDNPWVRVEYEGDDPDLQGKVGFAKAKDVVAVSDTKAALDGDVDLPDVPDAPDADLPYRLEKGDVVDDLPPGTTITGIFDDQTQTLTRHPEGGWVVGEYPLRQLEEGSGNPNARSMFGGTDPTVTDEKINAHLDRGNPILVNSNKPDAPDEVDGPDTPDVDAPETGLPDRLEPGDTIDDLPPGTTVTGIFDDKTQTLTRHPDGGWVVGEYPLRQLEEGSGNPNARSMFGGTDPTVTDEKVNAHLDRGNPLLVNINKPDEPDEPDARLNRPDNPPSTAKALFESGDGGRAVLYEGDTLPGDFPIGSELELMDTPITNANRETTTRWTKVGPDNWLPIPAPSITDEQLNDIANGDLETVSQAEIQADLDSGGRAAAIMEVTDWSDIAKRAPELNAFNRQDRQPQPIRRVSRADPLLPERRPDGTSIDEESDMAFAERMRVERKLRPDPANLPIENPPEKGMLNGEEVSVAGLELYVLNGNPTTFSEGDVLPNLPVGTQIETDLGNPDGVTTYYMKVSDEDGGRWVSGTDPRNIAGRVSVGDPGDADNGEFQQMLDNEGVELNVVHVGDGTFEGQLPEDERASIWNDFRQRSELQGNPVPDPVEPNRPEPLPYTEGDTFSPDEGVPADLPIGTVLRTPYPDNDGNFRYHIKTDDAEGGKWVSGNSRTEMYDNIARGYVGRPSGDIELRGEMEATDTQLQVRDIGTGDYPGRLDPEVQRARFAEEEQRQMDLIRARVRPYASPDDVLTNNAVEALRSDSEPITTSSPSEAVQLLSEGKKVKLSSKDEVAVLLDEIVTKIQEITAAGDDKPVLNLCDVFIEDASVFCAENKNFARLEMPQLSGNPIPGSTADGMPRRPDGGVDLAVPFRTHLEEQGIDVTPGTVQASHLKATQNELDGATVAGIEDAIAEGTFDPQGAELFISRDNYIVDGHHRWASTFANGEDNELNVVRVDMDILDLLVQANDFAEDMGIPPKRVGEPGSQGPDADRPNAPEGREVPNVSDAEALPQFDDTDLDSTDPDSVRTFMNDAIESVGGLDTEDADRRGEQLDAMYTAIGFGSGLDTDVEHNRRGPAEDMWSEERAEVHEEIWNELMTLLQDANIPQDRDSLVLGGLPGSGKSFSLRPGETAAEFGVVAWEPPEPPPEGATHISINPDLIKEMLISRGMLPPDLPEDLKPMEAVNFIHEESSYLSKMFIERLSLDGYNMVLDGTMAKPSSMQKKMLPLADEGYSFRALFADISVAESRESARARYARGMNTPMGGRFVPSGVQKPSTSSRMSPNRDVFDELAGIDEDGNVSGTGWFTEFIVVDNTGVTSMEPRKEITVRGTGDGTSVELARERRREGVSASAAPITAGGTDMTTDAEFTKMLFKGEITPEEGLQMLKDNKVAVYPDPAEGIDRKTASWDDIIEIADGRSGIQSALFAVGGSKLAAEYSAEIARARAEGNVTVL